MLAGTGDDKYSSDLPRSDIMIRSSPVIIMRTNPPFSGAGSAQHSLEWVLSLSRSANQPLVWRDLRNIIKENNQNLTIFPFDMKYSVEIFRQGLTTENITIESLKILEGMATLHNNLGLIIFNSAGHRSLI